MENTPQSQPTSASPLTTNPPGWWSRNWKWFVPTGCFVFLILGVLVIAAFVFAIFAALKSTDVYQTALARAKASAEVQAALGTPIKEGLFVGGNTSVSGSSGTADISLPISGPKGKATVYAIATKKAGRWVYSTLEVEVANRKKRIDLHANEPGE